jgi:hypothetical protein
LSNILPDGALRWPAIAHHFRKAGRNLSNYHFVGFGAAIAAAFLLDFVAVGHHTDIRNTLPHPAA